MTEHVLKIHPEPFADLLSGAKTGEVRACQDRDFQVGDTVLLQETAHLGGHGFSGRTMRRTVTHVQRGYGLPEWMCVLSYAPPERANSRAAYEAFYTEKAKTLPLALGNGPLRYAGGQYVNDFALFGWLVWEEATKCPTSQ